MRERLPAVREKLLDLREGTTWHFMIHTRDGTTVKGYVQTGLYPDGRLGEVFVKMGKQGDEGAWIDQWAIAFSLLLQLGLSLEETCRKFTNSQFDPAGATNSADVPRCTSLVDLVCRWLLAKYGKKEEEEVTS
jgi:ribonucleoside-diphosphate reductase alpha chain